MLVLFRIYSNPKRKSFKAPIHPPSRRHLVLSVGSNDFRRRCSELSKKADNTYNKMIMSNQQGVNGLSTAQDNAHDAQGEVTAKDAHDVPKRRVRRKYMFVNWLVTGQNPPLQSNSRFPVSEEEIINYSVIVELAHSAHKK